MAGPTRGEDLVQPLVVSSENGGLFASLSFEVAKLELPGLSMTGRAYNGTFPGPTLRLQPGTTLNMDFFNNADYGHDQISASSETNIHFHGLHISGEEPSDDVTIVVKPGESYQYRLDIPSNHLPGTHFLHPHLHGLTALHLGGGAVAAVIIEDPDNYVLPSHVKGAREFVLILQIISVRKMRDMASQAKDSLLDFSMDNDTADYFSIVNGQVQPVIRVEPGEWVRFRVISAPFKGGGFEVSIPGCEMQLLAKDGIYIFDGLREISAAPIPPGGRADIMLRCPNLSSTYELRDRGSTIATIETSDGPEIASTALDPWTPVYPSYLDDLRETPASPGCFCKTEIGRHGGINGMKFRPGHFLHKTYLGAVVEREILNGNQGGGGGGKHNRDHRGVLGHGSKQGKHPYHQHVYPFQLVGGIKETDYYKVGDWHDVFGGNGARIRYSPRDFAGKIVLHCHKLNHEDRGMMAMEWIEASGESCSCGRIHKFDLPRPAVVAILAFTLAAVLGLVLGRRSRREAIKSKQVKPEQDPSKETEMLLMKPGGIRTENGDPQITDDLESTVSEN